MAESKSDQSGYDVATKANGNVKEGLAEFNELVPLNTGKRLSLLLPLLYLKGRVSILPLPGRGLKRGSTWPGHKKHCYIRSWRPVTIVIFELCLKGLFVDTHPGVREEHVNYLPFFTMDALSGFCYTAVGELIGLIASIGDKYGNRDWVVFRLVA